MRLTSLISLIGGSSATSHRNLAASDWNDPMEGGNVLGTYCDVHGCERQLDEAPLVQSSRLGTEQSMAKRSLFPNSWHSVASLSPQTRGGWFLRGRRPKMIAVRYCEKCREAAEKWLEEHGA